MRFAAAFLYLALPLLFSCGNKQASQSTPLSLYAIQVEESNQGVTAEPTPPRSETVTTNEKPAAAHLNSPPNTWSFYTTNAGRQNPYLDDIMQQGRAPINAQHQLLPPWLALGSYAFSEVMQHIESFNPIIYVGYAMQRDAMANEEEAPIRLLSPDIAMDRPWQIPRSPAQIIRYERDFYELSRYAAFNKQSIQDVWHEYFFSNNLIMYAVNSTFLETNGQMQLFFRGPYLERIIFSPKEFTAIKYGQSSTPFPSALTLQQSTLGDLFALHGVQGRLIIELNSRYNTELKSNERFISVHYQEPIIWHNLPLTLHYYTQLASTPNYTVLNKPIRHYTTIAAAPITSMTLFSHTDEVERAIFEIMQAGFTPTAAELAWLQQRFWHDIISVRANSTTTPPTLEEYMAQEWSERNNYVLLDGRIVAYPSGCLASNNHISLVGKDDFIYAGSMCQ